MTLSTNIGTVYTRNQILEQAFRKATVLGEGQTLTAQQVYDGQQTLNNTIWQMINQGLQLWKNNIATLFLVNSQAKYTLSTANVTTEYTQTTTSVAGVATDLTITVTDDSDITDGDYIGILLDDDSIQWTTVNGAPVANVVTITDALTGAVAIGNAVYNYTSKINKPSQITNAWRRVSSIDTPLEMISRSTYLNLPNKTLASTPTSIYYDRKASDADIYVWPTTSSEKTTLIQFSYQEPFFIFDSANDTCDAPLEYMNAIIYNLAVNLCIEYGVSDQTITRVNMASEKYMQEALSFDREDVSIFAQPNLDGSGGWTSGN